jgi:F0F1-type ATP synthase assembly protein I
VSPDLPSDDSGKKSLWVQLAAYSQLAIIFPAATFIGWLIGTALDRWFHTHWIFIAGLILGSMAGFVELIRLVSSTGSK